MNRSKIVWMLSLFIFCSFLYCGSNKESKIVDNGGQSSVDGGNGGSNGDGQGGFDLILGGYFNGFDAGIAGSGIYMLPSDFTPGVYGGYKLGEKFDLNESAGAAGDSGESSLCGTKILGIVRDFRGNNEQNGHPDFEHFAGSSASLGIVNPILGMDQKPVYSSSGPFIDSQNGQQTTSKLYFDQWYRNTDLVNKAYIVYLYFEPNQNILSFQSDKFFPLDNAGFGNGPNSRNYGFTTEIHTKFNYEGAETFTFIGDDDVWVFINNVLAIDLGGLHSKLMKSISLDMEASKLGITIGNNYNLDFFHAERHTSESNFRVDTNLAFTNCGTIIDGPLK